MGFALCATSGHTSHHSKQPRNGSKYARQMSQQYRHTQTKHQDFLSRQVNETPFQFIPHFKSNSLTGQTVLSLLIFSSLVQIVSAADNSPPTAYKGTGTHNLRPSTSYDCVVSSTSQECVDYKASSILGSSNLRSASNLAAATTSGLSELFCPQKSQCVQVKDGQVFFTGTEEVVNNIEKKLGDFSEIRKDLIPPSPEAAKTQAHPEARFDKPTDLLVSLGVPPEDLENMAVSDYKDCSECADALGLDYDRIQDLPICTLSGISNNIIAINYKGSDNGAISFNQRTADSFLAFLKQQSPFFKFVIDTNKPIITYTDQYIFMNYGVFNEYFSLLNPVKTGPNEEGRYTLTLPLDTVLKRLMAAVSGGISLEQTSIPGQFHVRTVTLRDKEDVALRQSTPPVIKIVLDRSGSMSGKPIDTINTNIPSLLKEFQDNLGADETLNIAIYSLNDQFALLQTFLLEKNSPLPKWERIEAAGGTDLTPFGRLLRVEDGESQNQIVVGITDGQHMGPNKLDADYYSALKALQASGSFAQPFLCRVGDGSDAFFVDMNQMFSGSYSRQVTIRECLDRVSQAIPELLVSKAPLVLTIGGDNKVVWQQNAQSGIQRTTETVQEGDEIVLGHYKATVKFETRAAKRARLQAELDALDDQL